MIWLQRPLRQKRQQGAAREQLPIAFVPFAARRLKERTMTTKAKTKTDKKPKQEKLGTYKQKQLNRELSDSFPASDPPSITQPSVKSGAPERKTPRK
jgi:hypothetical protein